MNINIYYIGSKTIFKKVLLSLTHIALLIHTRLVEIIANFIRVVELYKWLIEVTQPYTMQTAFFIIGINRVIQTVILFLKE